MSLNNEALRILIKNEFGCLKYSALDLHKFTREAYFGVFENDRYIQHINSVVLYKY